MNEQKESLITSEECEELAYLMNQKYAAFLDDRKFEILVGHEGPGVKAQVLLQNDAQSFYYPVEGRMLHEEEDMTARDAVLFLIDYIDLYFEEFLSQGEDFYVPIDWAKHQYDAVDFQIRGQILNLKVETMGDRLLTENSKGTL